jgi:hypothetical protein
LFTAATAPVFASMRTVVIRASSEKETAQYGLAVQPLAHDPDLRAVRGEAGLRPGDLDRLLLIDPDLLLLAGLRGDERDGEQRDDGRHPAPGDAGPTPDLPGEVVRSWDGTRCQGR